MVWATSYRKSCSANRSSRTSTPKRSWASRRTREKLKLSSWKWQIICPKKTLIKVFFPFLFGRPWIVCKSRFHIQLYIKYILYGWIKYVAWFYKGGKCRCFVLINKWCSWVQSTFGDLTCNPGPTFRLLNLRPVPSVTRWFVQYMAIYSNENLPKST